MQPCIGKIGLNHIDIELYSVQPFLRITQFYTEQLRTYTVSFEVALVFYLMKNIPNKNFFQLLQL